MTTYAASLARLSAKQNQPFNDQLRARRLERFEREIAAENAPAPVHVDHAGER